MCLLNAVSVPKRTPSLWHTARAELLYRGCLRLVMPLDGKADGATGKSTRKGAQPSRMEGSSGYFVMYLGTTRLYCCTYLVYHRTEAVLKQNVATTLSVDVHDGASKDETRNRDSSSSPRGASSQYNTTPVAAPKTAHREPQHPYICVVGEQGKSEICPVPCSSWLAPKIPVKSHTLGVLVSALLFRRKHTLPPLLCMYVLLPHICKARLSSLCPIQRESKLPSCILAHARG